MKKTIRIASLILCAVFVLSFLSGCNSNGKDSNNLPIEYNARIVLVFPKQAFLDENRVSGTYDCMGNYETEESLPESRVFIVDSALRADEVFDDYPEIDFEREIVVFYVYSCYNETGRSLKRVVRLDGGALVIDIEVTSVSRAEQPKPIQRYVAIKLDKGEYTVLTVSHSVKHVGY